MWLHEPYSLDSGLTRLLVARRSFCCPGRHSCAGSPGTCGQVDPSPLSPLSPFVAAASDDFRPKDVTLSADELKKLREILNGLDLGFS